MSREEDFQKRLGFISDKNNEEKMKSLKDKYTFHSLKFEEGMERWFDLWRKVK